MPSKLISAARFVAIASAPVSYTHLDVYKRQDWIVVSATSFGDVNNGNYHWDADSWSFKAPGQYCKRLNYVCQSGSTFTCYQSNTLAEATPTNGASLAEAGSSGTGSFVNADAGDTIVLNTLLSGEANSGSWSRV